MLSKLNRFWFIPLANYIGHKKVNLDLDYFKFKTAMVDIAQFLIAPKKPKGQNKVGKKRSVTCSVSDSDQDNNNPGKKRKVVTSEEVLREQDKHPDNTMWPTTDQVCVVLLSYIRLSDCILCFLL